MLTHRGDTIGVIREIFVNDLYKSKAYWLLFHVVDRPKQLVLGLRDCERLNLIHQRVGEER